MTKKQRKKITVIFAVIAIISMVIGSIIQAVSLLGQF
jgi:NADH:ubiquinone oxidoreductase subunit 2 (subunit N)